jgi:pimeloyl-ACP methyl ester carboxylesterase/DNA-binding winged helix-turn-helix (wHTH) protein
MASPLRFAPMRLRFADFTLDCDRFELRRGGRRLETQPKVWAFLRLLAENSQRALSKDEIFATLWPDVVVSEGSLQRLASVARQLLGPDAGRLLRTIRGVGYQLTAQVSVEDEAEPGGAARFVSDQKIRFCTTSDGYHIAWSQVGEGLPLVRALGWFTNLEMEWHWPAGRRLWEALSRRHSLVRYDGRGMGLSDPAKEFSPETRLRDLEAVIDAANLDRFALLGLSEGGHTALRYAARNPQRVSHLIVYGVPNSGPLSDEQKDFWRTVLSMVRQAWGRDEGPFGRFLAELFLGSDASAETLEHFDRMQRASADRETAKRYVVGSGTTDMREDVARVRIPTLVMHREDDRLCPFDEGRKLASRIPGARFLPLPGESHWPLMDDAGAGAFVQALEEFLAHRDDRIPDPRSRRPARASAGARRRGA